MSTKAVRVTISGKVQGVFFRAHTAEKAKALGITGYVKNLPDGRVEAVAIGTDSQIEQFLDYCQKGSPSSRVDDLNLEDFESDEAYGSFEIIG